MSGKHSSRPSNGKPERVSEQRAAELLLNWSGEEATEITAAEQAYLDELNQLQESFDQNIKIQQATDEQGAGGQPGNVGSRQTPEALTPRWISEAISKANVTEDGEAGANIVSKKAGRLVGESRHSLEPCDTKSSAPEKTIVEKTIVDKTVVELALKKTDLADESKRSRFGFAAWVSIAAMIAVTAIFAIGIWLQPGNQGSSLANHYVPQHASAFKKERAKRIFRDPRNRVRKKIQISRNRIAISKRRYSKKS